MVPEEAAWFKLTVQVVEAPDATVPGLQLKDVKVGGATVVIVPPVAVVGIALPAAEVLSALVTPTVAPEAAGDKVTVTTATTPFAIRFAFSPLELSPVTKHM